ncbi:hypothetical protein F5882DRAFT_393416 [Hyaloscypha sp. PMI_1271]|nr:hypothetical protein F5882DRAFT_393416 [Hyaloscypha sp. PMI_1271]
MNGYYEAPRDAEGGYTPPVGAVLQFTNLYDSSRFMLDEIRLAKGGPLNRGDVRALSLVIIKDLPRIPLPGNPEIDPHLRLRLKTLLQRTFRAHGKLDPQVIPDKDDEDMLALKDAFAEGVKRIYDAVVEALPNGSTFQRILLVLVAFSCAVALYYWVWKFSIPFFWNASPSAGRSDDVNFGGESTSASSGSPFVPLHQWVELYKGDMNMAADTYEDCEFWITSAVDLVARRTESLTTELQMLAMTIWLSRIRILQPFSRLLHIPSEEFLNAKALILYESYLSDVDNEKHYPESHAKMLKVGLGILETDMQRIEKEYWKSFPFQFRKLLEEVDATFRGKRPEPLPRPDVLEPFHLHYNYFRGLAEDSVFELFDRLNNLKDAIAAQRGWEKPLQEQINEISRAIAELKFAKDSAMSTKNKLETNGTMREAGAAIWAL